MTAVDTTILLCLYPSSWSTYKEVADGLFGFLNQNIGFYNETSTWLCRETPSLYNI